MAKKPSPSSRPARERRAPAEHDWRAGLASALKPSSKWRRGVGKSLRPPPKLTLSAWADEKYYLSAESAAEPGRWRTIAYQRGIMDSITDPNVVRVSVMKSSRIGYTKMIGAAIGYHIDQDPCPILVVQPTVEDAEGYSKEELAPMIRDVPVLAERVGAAPARKGRPKKGSKARESTARSSAETILHKTFPGGVLSVGGANSGRAFRRVSRRVVIFDEVDGYPSSAGSDGDPVKLGERRAEYYWNRKIIAGSTPLVAGSSRIEELFEAGDRRRYYVPCPHCGHKDHLRFNLRRDDEDREEGHVMRWPKDEPKKAHFVCRKCGCEIQETSKRAMIDAGEWVAAGEFRGHASFHIWAAYSLSPNATWGQIAEEFIEAKKRPETLKTFVNTTLGETWADRGEAPDWELLQQRRELYKIGTVPTGVIALTCGVDVQKDRFVYEVVGWALNKESWSIDAGILLGDTAKPEAWAKLDALLDRRFPAAEGELEYSIAKMAVDSGYNTQVVYNWCRRKPRDRVLACKGVATARVLVGAPTKIDVNANGKKLRRGGLMWPVGVDIAKGEFYAWLGLRRDELGVAPPGYCHFPEYGDEFFKQVTAEHLVTTVNKKGGRSKMVWAIQPNRENHYLDCRTYARAAVSLLGLDTAPPPAPRDPGSPAPTAATPTRPPDAPKRDGFWKQQPRDAGRRGSWFKSRR